MNISFSTLDIIFADIKKTCKENNVDIEPAIIYIEAYINAFKTAKITNLDREIGEVPVNEFEVGRIELLHLIGMMPKKSNEHY
jgi:hypothetical protein